MIRILHRTNRGGIRTLQPAELEPGLLRASQGTLWVDFEAEPIEN